VVEMIMIKIQVNSNVTKFINSEKKICWYNKDDDKLMYGVAILEDNVITLEPECGMPFEHLEASDIKNGMTIQEIFDEIPKDITNYSLL
jgi:hypothetical protein